MSDMKFYEGESEEELDIVKENEKISQKLFEDLGLNKDEAKSQSKTNDIVKSYKVQSKINKTKLDFNPSSSSKNQILSEKLNSLQNELNNVSQEIQDYINFYNGNKVVKEAENFDNVLKELETYSNKLKNILSSDVYQNFINKNILPKDKNVLKNEIKVNLENYTNSTKKLFSYIANEKENFINQNNISTTAHEILISKDLNFDVDSNVEVEIEELEKQIENLEKTVGKRNINSNDEKNLTHSVITIIKLMDKYQKNKDTTLKELNDILDSLLKEKDYGSNLNMYFLKFRELYTIYQIYLNYDDIVKYIKNRILAINEINDCSSIFDTQLDFLKNIILDNEKKYNELNQKYNETFAEMSKLEEVLKELKDVEKYFEGMLV